MYRIPSFDSVEELSNALDIVFKTEPLTQVKKDFLIHLLTNPDIRNQSRRIRTFRQFSQLVNNQQLHIDRELRDCKKTIKQLLRARSGLFLEFSQELEHYLIQKLLSPEGAEYLLGGAHLNSQQLSQFRKYRYNRLDWWLGDELRRLAKNTTMKKTPKELEAEQKQTNDKGKKNSKYKLVVLTESKLTVREDKDGKEKDSILDQAPDPYSGKNTILDQLEFKETAANLINLLGQLSKTERSCIIARHWKEFSPHTDKENLAKNVISPLEIESRITMLDDTDDDQQRMVNVAYPDLTDSTERKSKLATLNKASTRAKKSLEKLFTEMYGGQNE